MPFTFAFYSRGDCEGQIRKAAETTPGIVQKGYVPKEALDSAIAQADILVNIGNASSRSLPSKTIEYIAYGKPILHISLQKQDVCKAYLARYPLALVVDQSTPIDEACRLVTDFMNQTRGQTVDKETICKDFSQNLPAVSAKAITLRG